MKWTRLAFGTVLVVVASLAVGCTGGGKGNVSGKVSLGDQPIPWGRITFASQVGKKMTFTSSIRNGSYEVKDVPAGKVKIAVESFPAKASSSSAPVHKMAKGFTPPKGEEPPPEVIGKYLPVPSKLASSETSGLEYTVTAGNQEHNIILK